MSTGAHVITSPSLSVAGFARKLPQQPRRTGGPRRSNPQQARALQAISHAIEHLVDSRLFDTWQSPSDAEAVRILMVCSRQVFQECDLVRPWPQRVGQTILRRLQLDAPSR